MRSQFGSRSGGSDQTGLRKSSEPIIDLVPSYLDRPATQAATAGAGRTRPPAQLEASRSRMWVDLSSDSIVTAPSAGKRQ